MKIFSVNSLHKCCFQPIWYVFLKYQRWTVWCNKVERSRSAICNVLSLNPLGLMRLYMFKSLTECCHIYGFYKKSLWIDYSRVHLYLNLLIGALLEASWFLYQNISDPNTTLCSDIRGLYGGPMKNAAMRSGSNVPVVRGNVCNIVGKLLPDYIVSHPRRWYRVFFLILHCHLWYCSGFKIHNLDAE